MLKAIMSTWTLFFGLLLISAGSGLQVVLLGTRAPEAGFTNIATGIVMSGYFAGIFAGLHYWQSWPWAAFDDAAAASTSRKRNIALRGCPGAAVGLRPGCRKNGTT